MLLYTFSSRHRFYQSELQASLSASTIGSSHDLFWNAGILKVGRWLSRAKPSPQKLRLLVSRRHCEEEERLKKILSQLLLLSRLGLKPKSVLFSVLPQSKPNAIFFKKKTLVGHIKVPYLTDFFSSRSNSIHQKSHPKWDLNGKKRWVVPLGIRLPLLLLKTYFLVSLFSSLRVRLWIYGHWRTELDLWPSIFLKWSCFTILTPVGAACAVLFHARYF